MSRRRLLRPAGGALPPLGRTVLVLLGLVGLALVAWVLEVNRSWPFAGDGYTVRASFADAAGLRPSDDATVTIAGVESGRVTGIAHRDGRAELTLRLDRATAGKLHADARATIRPRSQLGDLVVELTPGRRTAPALGEGDRIDDARTAASVPFSRVVSTLDADTRTHLQLLIGQLDRGVGGRRGRTLADALRRVEPLTRSADAVTAKLDHRRQLLTRLVGHLDVLFTTVGRRDRTLARAIAAARATLAVGGARSGELRRTVAELPATLTRTRQAVAAVDELGDDLDPALTALRPLARALPATLRDVRGALPDLSRLLAELDGTATATGPALRAARQTTTTLATAVPLLEHPVGRLDPIVRAIDRNRDGIGLLGERFSGIFSTADVNGTLLRGLGFFEPFNPANFGFPIETKGTARRDAERQVVTASLRACRTNALACLVPFLVPGLADDARRLGAADAEARR
ncbi:MlaD family protein [Patulibacter defluvii]|uniref:MlaD family protein n=1 Tax=Patulibacter defluvii TaxID=3095358 RepID=UPI002A74F123|nr:MlaD family protein [Patulibacter sp. DM4]